MICGALDICSVPEDFKIYVNLDYIVLHLHSHNLLRKFVFFMYKQFGKQNGKFRF